MRLPAEVRDTAEAQGCHPFKNSTGNFWDKNMFGTELSGFLIERLSLGRCYRSGVDPHRQSSNLICASGLGL